MANDDIRPTGVKLRRQSRVLELAYAGETTLPAGLGVPARATPPLPKCAATAEARKPCRPARRTWYWWSPVGHYAVRAGVRRRPQHRHLPWGYLRDLCENREQLVAGLPRPHASRRRQPVPGDPGDTVSALN